jgi:hypothetical protein
VEALALAAAALYLAAAPAQGHDQRYPNQRAAHEPELDAMRDSAQAFWQARGIGSPCSDTVLDVADSLADVDGANPHGRGYSPLAGHADCRIVLAGYYVGERLAWMRNRHRGVWFRRLAARELCRLVFHEEGHSRGLGHFGSGLMSGDGWTEQSMPWDCRVLARRWFPGRGEHAFHPRRPDHA